MTVNNFYEDSLREIGEEKEEIVREREKLHLETKKYNKMNSLRNEVVNTAPIVLKGSNGNMNHHRVNTAGPVMLKKQSTMTENKKKAADYYFNKKSPTRIETIDFMTTDIAPSPPPKVVSTPVKFSQKKSYAPTVNVSSLANSRPASLSKRKSITSAV